MGDTEGSEIGDAPIETDGAWSVTRLNDEIEAVLSDAQGRFPTYVVGEVSDVNPYDFGTFFDLVDLDGEATISCIVWSFQRDATDHDLSDGSETIVRGSVDFYQDDGRTQLAVQSFWPVGESDRSRALDELRARLESEGSFDDKWKRPLPEYPDNVGVVTSLSGSAREDFREAVRGRHPGMTITFRGATVQGDTAVSSLVDAIRQLEHDSTVDVIVITRGGGADADLWCFNEEPVVRAIADCATPTVVAVGHEDDETLAEGVADHRSMTPTDAGVAVAPDLARVSETVEQQAHRIERAYAERVSARLDGLDRRIDAGVATIERRVMTRAATRQRAGDLERRVTLAYESLVADRLEAFETRVRHGVEGIEHAAETDAVTARAARGRVRGLETRIDGAYRTHVERELETLNDRIDAGYRDVETAAKLEAGTEEARRLRLVVAVLIGLLVALMLLGGALFVGVV